jgi:hypothetical protein
LIWAAKALGVKVPRLECGRFRLKFTFQCSIPARASVSFRNHAVLKSLSIPPAEGFD